MFEGGRSGIKKGTVYSVLSGRRRMYRCGVLSGKIVRPRVTCRHDKEVERW